jgi:hypothetical protein
MTVFSRSLAFLTLLCFAAGCANYPLATERTPVSSMFHPTSSDRAMELNVTGPVEIDVESFGGDVFITADASRPQASVQVIRRAVHGGNRYREGRSSLNDISYTVEVVPGHMGQRVQVRTTTSHAEAHYQRADVHIRVPEVDGIYVRTRNGRVFTRGIQGEVDIVTTNGDVRVLTNQRMNRSVTILNNGGNIDYRVRGESSGHIDAESIGGRVTHRIRYGRCIVGPGTTYNRLNARFNGGDNPIVLRTVNGDIRIASVSEPERVGRFIFE